MEAKLFFFAVRDFNDEHAPFSHLSIAPSVGDVVKKFNDDLSIIDSGSLGDPEVVTIKDYLSRCSIWCLGSIDFLSGELVPNLEEHQKLIDVLEVLKNEIR